MGLFEAAFYGLVSLGANASMAYDGKKRGKEFDEHLAKMEELRERRTQAESTERYGLHVTEMGKFKFYKKGEVYWEYLPKYEWIKMFLMGRKGRYDSSSMHWNSMWGPMHETIVGCAYQLKLLYFLAEKNYDPDDVLLLGELFSIPLKKAKEKYGDQPLSIIFRFGKNEFDDLSPKETFRYVPKSLWVQTVYGPWNEDCIDPITGEAVMTKDWWSHLEWANPEWDRKTSRPSTEDEYATYNNKRRDAYFALTDFEPNFQEALKEVHQKRLKEEANEKWNEEYEKKERERRIESYAPPKGAWVFPGGNYIRRDTWGPGLGFVVGAILLRLLAGA